VGTEGEKPGSEATRPEAGSGAGSPPLRSVELKILLSAAVVLGILALLGRWRMLPGALCGAAIAAGNFFLMRKILEKAVRSGGTLGKGFAVRYVLKFLLLVALVYGVIRSGWFDAAGFLLGLSALFLGILLEGLSRAVEGKKPNSKGVGDA
jgi:hypothetical protein